MEPKELLKRAKEARLNAYAPYSGYRVGAALLSADGIVYTGCNIENAAFSPTICAERTALFKAVSEGARSFSAIAIVGGSGETLSEFAYPCGVCRQALREFCNSDFRLYFENSAGKTETYTLADLLPLSFSSENIKK